MLANFTLLVAKSGKLMRPIVDEHLPLAARELAKLIPLYHL